MNGSASNLKFEYLYRDAGNYKLFGNLVLSNPNQISPEEAALNMKSKLIDGEFFDPIKVNIPMFELFEYDSQLDHEWYEFEKFSWTSEEPTKLIDVESFIKGFE